MRMGSASWLSMTTVCWWGSYFPGKNNCGNRRTCLNLCCGSAMATEVNQGNQIKLATDVANLPKLGQSSQACGSATTTEVNQVKLIKLATDVPDLPKLLPIYYARLFPFNDYYRWLSYGNVTTFSLREFSFTIHNEIYIRFQSFTSQKQFENEVQRVRPFKIDIGAVYNKFPKQYRRDPDFKSVEKELVFDIDMSDYDEVRTCCDGPSICEKCWKFMALASKILDTTLRLDFGYDHLLWVFSGRRGIHCWVCDEEARKLSARVRGGITENMQVVNGGAFKKKKVYLTRTKIHYPIQRALDMIKPIFVPMCVEEQNILGTDKGMDTFLQMIQDEEDREELKGLFSQGDTSLARWNIFLKYVEDKKANDDEKLPQYRHLVEEVMLQCSYPRLDSNVSTGLNHLLKAPFSVHPKTGKICIPFTAETVDAFNPNTVPTIASLIEEVNELDKKLKQEVEDGAPSMANRTKDYKKTSLNKSIHLFQEFLTALEVSRKGQMIEKSDATYQF